jgi:multicomponent Na+:H+ antiporter subunit F
MSQILLAVAALGMLVTMSLALVRALWGPTVFDRILAVNMFGTKTVLMIGVLGFLSGRPAFLDIAVVYALMNFITIIAVLRYSNFEDLHLDVQSEKEAE